MVNRGTGDLKFPAGKAGLHFREQEEKPAIRLRELREDALHVQTAVSCRETAFVSQYEPFEVSQYGLPAIGP